MADNYWAIKPGLNNVGSYQVSGAPWAESVATSTSPGSVTFPRGNSVGSCSKP